MRNYGDLYGNVKLTRSGIIVTEPTMPISYERRYDKKTGVLVAEAPIYPGVHNDKANALSKKLSGDAAMAASGIATSVITGGIAK